MSLTIGIDLGTTNSAVAFHDGIGAQIIETAGGAPTLPSVVGEDESGALVVGNRALKWAVREPTFVFANIKRHIGLPFVDGEDYGPQVVKGPDGRRWFQGRSRIYSAEELSAEILKALKSNAERRLGQEIRAAVITHPAWFNNKRIAATQEAARLAGFKKATMITEPEAAVLAYGLHRSKYQRVLVFDMGGGTLDIVYAETGEGLFKPLAKSGDDELGGVDFDRRIRDRVLEVYAEKHRRDLRSSPQSLLKIAPEAEAAKKELSESLAALIDIQNLAFDPEASMMRDISLEITRDEFDRLTADLVAQAMDVTARVMESAGRTVQQVDAVLLVGGMTRVPAVRRAVAEYFGAAKLRDAVSADLVVAIGASIRAAEKDRRLSSMAIEDVTAQAFGLEVEGGEFLQVIPKGAPYGEARSIVVTTLVDGQEAIPLAILQGGELEARRNALLARHTWIAPVGAPAGGPSLQLNFSLDESGVLTVRGKDLDRGDEFTILEG